MSTLKLDDITVRYGGQRQPAVAGASLSVEQGEFVVLTGRSGCGKTTLLSVAAGLVDPTEGCITIDGEAIHGPGRDRAKAHRALAESIRQSCPMTGQRLVWQNRPIRVCRAIRHGWRVGKGSPKKSSGRPKGNARRKKP